MEDLSLRGRISASHEDLLGKYINICLDNPWSPKNPSEGCINLGTAENFLCEEILLEKLNSFGLNKFEPWMFHYFRYHGDDWLLKSVSKFIDRYFQSQNPVDHNQLSMVLGTCSAVDILAHSICEPGDVFLVPAPHYNRTYNDCHERSLVGTFPIQLDVQEQPFLLTQKKVEFAYENATSKGKNVKGMIMINPSNPLGAVYPPDLILEILEFAKSQNLWVIFDEIYALSVFNLGAKFQSIFSFYNQLPDPQKTVWLWGLGKDFGLPGFRVSFLHSPNEVLQKSVRKLCEFQCVPAPLHPLVHHLLSDFHWLDTVFFPENRRRMLRNHRIATAELAKLDIDFVPSDAGFFIWADFRKFLKKQDFEGEMDLFRHLVASGVYLAPGQVLFSSQPGRFRIIFTVSQEMLSEGLKRMSRALENYFKP